jgi:DNA-binding transcriptional LysR family regulator
MLTLRQIEVIRAILVTGTVGGAARLLNVSSPGISRVMKHAEAIAGIRLFSRESGRYSPTREASAIFSQINEVYDKVEDLQFVISRMTRGTGAELKLGSVPSIGQVMIPRAIADVRRAFPSLLIDVDILKIEEAIDYLLLGKGEVVAVSYQVDHPMLSCEPLAQGKLKCIVSKEHQLVGHGPVTVAEIVKHKLIGIDPGDPYGRIMANLFAAQSLSYDVTIRSAQPFALSSLPAWALRSSMSSPWPAATGPRCMCWTSPSRRYSRLTWPIARMPHFRRTRRGSSPRCGSR